MMNEMYLNQARLVLRILPLLKEFPHFCLKGGTAINFFVQNLPRLSVDIDLTYIPINNRLEALNEITTSMESLKSHIERLFYAARVIEKRTKEGFIRGLLINVDNTSIKIEPNQVIRGTVFEPQMFHLTSKAEKLFEIELEFPILSLPDLYGGKICAALDRQHPRDLFDILLMNEYMGFTEELKQALLVYVISHPRPISEVLNPNRKELKDIYEKEFRYMTERSVSVEELENVREDLIKTIISSMTDSDKKFLLSIKSGNPQWKLHSCPHVKDLPAVQWKLKNIAKMGSKQKKDAYTKLMSVLFDENA